MKKKSIKKVIKSLFATAVTVGSLFNGSIKPVEAAGYTLTVTTPYGVNMSAGDKWAIGTNSNAYGYDVYAPLYINGTHVYCIQQNALTVDGAGDYSPEALGTYTGSMDLTRKLEYISALGFGFNGDNSQEMDFATQIRIWQEMGLGSVTNIHPDIQAKIDQINARLNVMYKDVSFNNSTVMLHGYGKENAVTVDDSNGVFSYYHDYDTNGIHSERSGNSLTVWAEEGDALNAALKYDCYYLRNQTGTSLAYCSGSSQNVAFLAGIDPTNTLVNVKLQLGTIQLTKADFERDNDPQGDAIFEGATFDVIDDKTGLSVGTLVSDAEGTTNKIEKLQTDRTYTIVETIAPVGYRLSGESKKVDFSTIGNPEDNIKEFADKFNDNVVTGSMELRKVITDGSESEITEPEVNAEFIVMLKKYVDQYGSIEEAYNHKDEYSDREYDYLVTDKDGNAYTKQLAFGLYVVKQVAVKDETDLLKKPFEFNIDEQGKHFQYTINNIPSKYYVRLVKKDMKTGQNVTLSSASFKIKDSKGNYVTMKVGGRKYDTFTTSSDGGVGILDSLFGGNYYNGEEAMGTTVTPLALNAGKYTVEEIKTPNGFLDTGPIEFTIKKEYVNDMNEDQDKYIEVVIENNQPTGTLKVHKTVEEYNDADTTYIDRKDLTGIAFTLTAKENIISAIDGTVLYNKGQTVAVYTTDKAGNITASDIPMGKYVLKETGTLPGLVLDTKEYNVVFEQKDTTTKVYEVSYNIENKSTKVEFSKKSVTGQDELEGAEITVKDINGVVVDKWTSGKNTHIIEGLTVGGIYVMEETVAADGYVKASNIQFEISNTGEVQHVDMIDKIVDMSKVDMGGKEVEGAEMTVTDEDGNVVDEWTSTTESHKIKGLEEGKTYVLHENTAPAGYVLATDIEFTVSEEKVDEHIEMTDKKVTVSKQDVGGEEITGATITVKDEDGNVVDEWVSGDEPHDVEGLEVGKTYTLTETIVPRGFVKVSELTFTVKDDGIDEYFELVDTIETIAKVDQNGNVVIGAHLQILDTMGTVVDEWTTGTNVLETIAGSLETEMKATGIKVTTSSLEDGKVEEKEIYTLIVTDASQTDETKKWSYYYVDKDGFELLHWASNLEAGMAYELHEVEAPENYIKSENVSFVAPKDADETVEMKDIKTDKVSITKYDATNKKELPGAKLKVIDKGGKIIDEWTSTKKEHIIEGLVVGEEYTLVEEIAPDGYKKTESIKFVVEDNGAVVQKVKMYDKKQGGSHTGIQNNMGLYLAGTVVGLLGAVAVVLKKKSKE